MRGGLWIAHCIMLCYSYNIELIHHTSCISDWNSRAFTTTQHSDYRGKCVKYQGAGLDLTRWNLLFFKLSKYTIASVHAPLCEGMRFETY